MKKIFRLRITSYDKALTTKAIEAGVDAIICPDELVEKIQKLAVIPTIAPKKWDKRLWKDVAEVTITKKEDEEKVVAYKGSIPVIITNKDRTIIPLENLISKTTNLIQTVSNATQAKLALETMEKWADGICLETNNIQDIIAVGKIMQQKTQEEVQLQELEIVSTKNVGMASRCCIDTCSLLEPGTGMLIGDSSACMFLVYNENVESPYCDPRPFRVNAWAAHAYIRCPNNKTKYLCELKSGDEVLVINPQGKAKTVTVGRNKIEERPMICITAQYGDQHCTLIIQNAETVRLTKPDGLPIAVTHLKAWDTILGYTEQAGRHFGVQVDETIREN